MRNFNRHVIFPAHMGPCAGHMWCECGEGRAPPAPEDGSESTRRRHVGLHARRRRGARDGAPPVAARVPLLPCVTLFINQECRHFIETNSLVLRKPTNSDRRTKRSNRFHLLDTAWAVSLPTTGCGSDLILLSREPRSYRCPQDDLRKLPMTPPQNI